MRVALFVLFMSSMSALAAQGRAALVADPPITCGNDCEVWNTPRDPFRVFGNTYVVGTRDLGAVLITSARGHILIDGGLPQSAPIIDTNIRTLGFHTSDIRLIVNSHAHYDHAGGIAALQRASRATVAASASGARALRAGRPTPDDPQVESSRPYPYPRVERVRVVNDGETIRVGDLRITAHLTPGHTPGSTAWSWRSCEGATCVDVVYADSLTSISDDGFRFTGDSTRPSVADAFRRSIDKVASLPCDIVLASHPGMVGIEQKLQRRAATLDTNPFIDPQGCQTYARGMMARLERRIAEERASGSKPQ